MRKNESDATGLPFPAEVIAEARRMLDPDIFDDAEDALQAAMDANDSEREAYWRDAFRAYPYLVTAPGRRVKVEEHHLMMTAAMFAAGIAPKDSRS